MLTQLTPSGLPGQPYGSFAGKEAGAEPAGPHTPGRITQLSPSAIPGGRYAFVAKGASAEPEQPPVQSGESRGGGISHRKHRRTQLVFAVTIGGETFYFDSFEEALAALQRQEPFEKIEEKAERDAQRIIRLGKVKAKPKPPKVTIHGPAEYRSDIDELEKKVKKLYWEAVANYMASQAEEEEDLIAIASISFD